MDDRQPPNAQRSRREALVRWVERRGRHREIPRAPDGWPDVRAWRDAAEADGLPCDDDEMREALRIALLFRRIASARRDR